MPIYEYVCKSCGHAFEHLARSVSAPAPACPQCGVKRVAKQFSTFSARSAGPKAAPCAAGACPEGGRGVTGCGGGCCPL